ncbi:MAG: OmpA family protein, partial [Woeseiaceae bacterium]
MTGYKFIGTGLLCLMLTGCGSTPVPDPEPTESGAAADDGRDGSSSGMAGEEFGRGEEFGDDVAQEDLGMIIYFDFDQSDLRPEYADLLARHAANLVNNSGTTVRLEGHADERGSREYN